LINPFPVTVYAFILNHTIAAGVTSRADIKLINEKQGYFRLEEQKESHPLTEYNLMINNPSALGFSSTEGSLAKNRINYIVLSINLTLVVAALSRRGSILSTPTIISTNERNKEHIKEALVREQQQEDGNIIRQVVESIGISEHNQAVLVSEQQQLDESCVLTNLKLIHKIDWHIEDHQGNTTRHNLAKALRDYEGAFNNIEREKIFKDIFNAVEEAVNWDTGRDGWKLDNELSSVAKVAPNKAAQWRCIYNRIKHPDHNQQPAEYLTAVSQIPNELVPLRLAANTVFLERLKKV
jgi:hypothetical protein